MSESSQEPELDGIEIVRNRSAPRRRRPSGGVVLAAAMTAVGEILEPEKTKVEVVQTNDEPLDDSPFDIDFGDLPPLS